MKADEEIKPLTKHIRIRADLAEMVSAIVWHQGGGSAADLLDPLVRPQVKAMFHRLPKSVQERARRKMADLAEPVPAE